VFAVARLCSRTGCSEAAAATLTYDYGHALAWLDPLHDERDPHHYDLCDRHASRVSPPRGWDLRDRRAWEPPAATSLIAV